MRHGRVYVGERRRPYAQRIRPCARRALPSAAKAATRMRLERCSRLLPHDQDTGGFFIALLRKRRPLGSEGGDGAKAASSEAPKKKESGLNKKQLKAAKLLACDEKAWAALRKERGFGGPPATPFRLSVSGELRVPAGATWAVVGPVGCGKSSFLHALLGEMERQPGSSSVVELCGSTAYAAQTAFVVNATIRENICFGTPYSQEAYDRVVDACCLALLLWEDELALMTHGKIFCW